MNDSNELHCIDDVRKGFAECADTGIFMAGAEVKWLY